MECIIHAVVLIICQRLAVARDDDCTAQDLRLRQSHVGTTTSRLYVLFSGIGIAPDLHDIPSDKALLRSISTAPLLQRPFYGQLGPDSLMRQGFITIRFQLETPRPQDQSNQKQTDG